ncbi:MAG TPA: hypothetical protein VF944_00250 [Candidatus Bathyarchaeia archaeon]
MRIEPDEHIAGLPALEIRRFMKRTGDLTWDLDLMRAELGVSLKDSKKVAKRLEALGLIERVGTSWRKTVKGNALANASAARPLTRATADVKLKQFLERVDTVNRNQQFAYRIRKVIVFGSFLTGRERINDIDIAIAIVPRHADPDLQVGIEDRRVSEARRKGRRFKSFGDELMWPKREVVLFLRSRSRALSIHSLEDEESIVKAERHRVLFEDLRQTASPTGS